MQWRLIQKALLQHLHRMASNCALVVRIVICAPYSVLTVMLIDVYVFLGHVHVPSAHAYIQDTRRFLLDMQVLGVIALAVFGAIGATLGKPFYCCLPRNECAVMSA